jgi:hypothetical protein
MTATLNDMLAREHVQDRLCEAEEHRVARRAREQPREPRRHSAGFFGRWRRSDPAEADASIDDG